MKFIESVFFYAFQLIRQTKLLRIASYKKTMKEDFFMIDMRKRMIKTLILTAVFAVVLAACGQAADPAGGAAAPAAPAPAAAAEAPAAVDAPDGHDPRAYQPVPAGDWRTPFPYPVHMTIGSTLGVNWHFEGTDHMGDSPWTRLIADELNVHVEFPLLEMVDYDLQLQLAVAADNLPDVFFIPMGIQRLFNQLQSAGTLLDITHAYNNYASQRIRDFELVDPFTIQTYMVDGRLYALPRYYYGQIDQPRHLWVRKDWYEAEGRPEIRTVTDLENLAHAFMNNHGALYGISVDNELRHLMRSAAMFGAYMGDIHHSQYFWRPDATGRLRPCISFPEFIIALEYWQRWFAEGIISPEFMAMGPGDRVHEDVVNGLVGIQPWYQWWGWMNGHNIVQVQQDNDTYFLPFNFPTVDGSRPARGIINFPNTGILAAHRDFQNPGAWMKALSLIDMMIFSPEGAASLTPEGFAYFFDGHREHAMGPTLKMIDPNTDLLQFQYINRALATGDASNLFTTVQISKHNDIMDWLERRYPPIALGAFLQLGFPESAYGRSQHLFDNGWIVENAMWGPPPIEFDEAGLTGDMILEEVMLIIMGVNPPSHFTDVVLPNWYAHGGQIKEDAINLHFGS